MLMACNDGPGINMDMILKLHEPGHLLLGENLLDDLTVLKDLKEGELPWWVLSDVLISSGREFVGIVSPFNAARLGLIHN
jgi:hypothetical protein